MGLTKEQIFAAKFDRLKRVHVPEWGGDVWVKALSADERDSFEADNREVREAGGDPYRGLRARLAVITVCDEAGNLLFDDGDAAELGKRLAGPLDKIADVAMQLCGMSKRDAQQLVDELKNAQAAASPSG